MSEVAAPQAADNRLPGWTLEMPRTQLGADVNAPNPTGLAERIEEKELSNRSFLEQGIHMITASQARLITASVSAGIFLVLYLVFVVCEGIYGYSGPDMKTAWYIDGVDTPSLSRKGAITMATEREIPIKEGYPVDMAKLFRTWFLWGFWGSIMQMLIVCVFVPLFIMHRQGLRVKSIVFISVQGVQCCSTVMWFILGFFWRFSRGGRVVSGEVLEKSSGDTDEEWKVQLENAAKSDGYQFYAGSFMSVYLWLIITILFIGLCAFGSYGAKLWLDEQRRKDEEELPEDEVERRPLYEGDETERLDSEEVKD
mmetsp:Transcript_25131/g.29494  ORF Transcript_25131/g.29494 Transcript_25131/m.29494 type:complete len:311 (+) Transcript_25131:50-982(+)